MGKKKRSGIANNSVIEAPEIKHLEESYLPHDKIILLKNVLKQKQIESIKKKEGFANNLPALTALYNKLLFRSESEMQSHIIDIQSCIRNIEDPETRHTTFYSPQIIEKLFDVFVLSGNELSYTELLKFYGLNDEDKGREAYFYNDVAVRYMSIGDFDNTIANAKKTVTLLNKLLNKNYTEKTKKTFLSAKANALYNVGKSLLISKINANKAASYLEESYNIVQDPETLLALYDASIYLKRFDDAKRWASKVENERLESLLVQNINSLETEKYNEISFDSNENIGSEFENTEYRTYAINYRTRKAIADKDYKQAVELQIQKMELASTAVEKVIVINMIQVICIMSGDLKLYSTGAKLFGQLEDSIVLSEPLKISQLYLSLELGHGWRLTGLIKDIDQRKLDEEDNQKVSHLCIGLALSTEHEDIKLKCLQEALRFNPKNIEAAHLQLLLQKEQLVKESHLNTVENPDLEYKKINDDLEPEPPADEKEDDWSSVSYDEESEDISEDEEKEGEITGLIEASNEQYRLLENLSNLPIPELDKLLLEGLIDINTFHKYCQLVKSRVQAQIHKDAGETAAKLFVSMVDGSGGDVITWDLDKYGVISSKDQHVVKFKYQGKPLYAVIAPALVQKMDQSGKKDEWFNALDEGLADRHQGANGVKIFGGAAELKLVSKGSRPFTDTMIYNINGDRLIFLNKIGPHKTIKRIANENNSLKVKVVGLGDAVTRGHKEGALDIDKEVCKQIYDHAKKDPEAKKDFIDRILKDYKKEVAALAAFKLEEIAAYHDSLEKKGVQFLSDTLVPDLSSEYFNMYNEVSSSLMGE